jgi:secretion/DNA translocation related TadE-like protein
VSRRSERGSVTIVTVTLLALVLVVALGVADLTAVMLASSRAQDAADAAALAAAVEIAMPSGRAASDVAAEYAARNGGSLVECSCDPAAFAAEVRTRVPVGPLLLFDDDRAADASARAVVDTP